MLVDKLPEPIITLIRNSREILFYVLNPFDWVYRFVARKEGLPPLPLRLRVGELRDWEGSGGEYVAYLKLLCDLQTSDRLLDIGCGCGLLGMKLTSSYSLIDYLVNGEYVGMDTHLPSIKWLQKHCPDGKFIHIEAEDFTLYKFPWMSEIFNVAILKSVFTHTFPAETRNYLNEIHRMLLPGGRCLATFYLLDKQILTGKYTFPFYEGNYSLQRQTKPRLAIAYEMGYLTRLVRDAGFTCHVYKGGWRGDAGGLSYQDVVVMRRK